MTGTSDASHLETQDARVPSAAALGHYYRAKKVVITGGLGFLGSSLAQRLVPLGAKVTLVDSLNPMYGGNRFNIQGIDSDVTVVVGDVRDIECWHRHLVEAQIVFHLAAQVSYIDSLSMPLDDLAINAGSVLQLLEECRKLARPPKVVFASSRMVVGKVGPGRLREDAATNPLTLYGVHKLAAEKYLTIYYRNFGIPSVALRITNPYGPRQQIHHSKYSLVGWFVRQAMENRTIKVFGDGHQQRDYIFIDDIVQAFLRAAMVEGAVGEVVNVGSGTATTFDEMVRTVIEVVGKGRIEYVPWPSDYEHLETGDVVADVSELQRLTGWRAQIGLRTGVERTAEYYTEHWDRYVR